MGWAIEALANVFLEILNDVMRFMMAVIQGITFDNAASYHTLTEAVFPGLASFSVIFRALAFSILALLALFKMIQVVFDHEGKAEHPASLLGRTAVAAMLITISYRLVAGFITTMSSLYKVFFTQMEASIDGGIEGLLNTPSAFRMFGTDLIDKYEWGEGIGLTVLMAMVGVTLTTYFFMVVLEFIQRYVLIDIMFVSSPLAFACVGSRDTSQIFKKWAQAFFSNFLVMMLILVILGSFIGGFQYITSGQHYLDTVDKYPDSTAQTREDLYSVQVDQNGNEITNPVAEGYTWMGTENGNDIWEKDGERLTVATDESGATTGVVQNAPRFLFHDGKDFAYSMLILLSIVVIGTKIDQYIRDLGLGVFQTGEGMGRALLGSAMILREGARATIGGIKAGGSFVGSAVTGRKFGGNAGAAGKALHDLGERGYANFQNKNDTSFQARSLMTGTATNKEKSEWINGFKNDDGSFNGGKIREALGGTVGEDNLNSMLYARPEFRNVKDSDFSIGNDGSFKVQGSDGNELTFAGTNYTPATGASVGHRIEGSDKHGVYMYENSNRAMANLETRLPEQGYTDIKPVQQTAYDAGGNRQGVITTGYTAKKDNKDYFVTTYKGQGKAVELKDSGETFGYANEMKPGQGSYAYHTDQAKLDHATEALRMNNPGAPEVTRLEPVEKTQLDKGLEEYTGKTYDVNPGKYSSREEMQQQFDSLKEVGERNMRDRTFDQTDQDLVNLTPERYTELNRESIASAKEQTAREIEPAMSPYSNTRETHVTPDPPRNSSYTSTERNITPERSVELREAPESYVDYQTQGNPSRNVEVRSETTRPRESNMDTRNNSGAKQPKKSRDKATLLTDDIDDF